MIRAVLVLIALGIPMGALAHEADEDRIDIFDAQAHVLDGDTSTLFVTMSIANQTATTSLVGFETSQGQVGDWIEIRRVFGRERVKVQTRKTLRTNSVYHMQLPHAYVIIKNVDPAVYRASYGYLALQVSFDDGTRLDVAAWIDEIYLRVEN